uniref:Ubiquitin-like protease family profile domain-containing protein n=1 Tax=Glossina palpalis gambiensis TaxID=67801 RepID=A0A1B0C5G1_9MUSC
MERKFATYAKIDILSSDFQRLAPERWLNDRLVEAYAQWLLREGTTEEMREQIHLFSPFQYTKITQKPPNWGLLRRQASRSKLCDKRCLIIPVCDQNHWRLFFVAHPEVTSKKGAMFVLDPLPGYPNAVIATQLRRYVAFLNTMKHGSEIHLTEEALPLIEVPVPGQYNQVDCGVLALQNLKRYLRQGKASWDPLTLPETWSTGAEAQQTRIKIAAVLLELAAMEGEARVSAKEPVNDADDVTIITPTAEPITVRTMTTDEPARTTTANETRKPWTNEEPISLGVIVPNNPDDDLLHITPTIGLLGGTPATPKPILGEGDDIYEYLLKTEGVEVFESFPEYPLLRTS